MPEAPPLHQARRGRQLAWWRQILYAAGNFGVAFSPTVVAAWLGYFYCGQETEAGEPRLYLSTATFGTIWLLCNVLNGPTDPIVGYLSDRSRSRWGRRKPWVIIGAPLLALSFFFLWTPATEGPSLANAAILFAALFGFWFFFTVVVAPYLSLLPEITPYDDERVRISAYMGVYEVVGTAAGNLVPPLFAGLFASGLFLLGSGYQVMGLLVGALLVVFFLVSTLAVRESYQPPPDEDDGAGRSAVGRAMREFGSTFRNKPFVPYVIGIGFYRMAVATTVFIAPFIATKVIAAYPSQPFDLDLLGALGAVEDSGRVNWELAAGYMMMLVLGGAALFFPLTSWLANRLGKRSLFIVALSWFGVIMLAMASIGWWPLPSPLLQAMSLFLLAAVPVSIALVVGRPLLADVIDADEVLTGRRREGVYNGMEGLIMKVAAGVGPAIAGLLFGLFGQTSGDNLGIRLCGPLAGVCLLAAALAFSRYPIRK